MMVRIVGDIAIPNTVIQNFFGNNASLAEMNFNFSGLRSWYRELLINIPLTL